MHLKESVADFCQACLDEEKNAEEGEKKCNRHGGKSIGDSLGPRVGGIWILITS